MKINVFTGPLSAKLKHFLRPASPWKKKCYSETVKTERVQST